MALVRIERALVLKLEESIPDMNEALTTIDWANNVALLPRRRDDDSHPQIQLECHARFAATPWTILSLEGRIATLLQ